MTEPHTQAVVPALPPCDICKDGTRARYDGKTTYGPWGYLCEDCFAEIGVGLGLGRGQRLVTPDEVMRGAVEDAHPKR